MILATLKLDHLTLIVPDLDEARSDFAGLGFTDMDHGFDATRSTGGVKTMIVPFADGSSLHVVSLPNVWKRGALYAFKALGLLPRVFRNSPPPVQRLIRGVARGQGLADATFHMGALDVLAAAMGARGFESDGTYAARKVRHDGHEIRYHILSLPDIEEQLPLIICDETPIIMRMPAPDNCFHVNGVRGIAGYTVPVADMAESEARWAALTGGKGQDAELSEHTVAARSFNVGRCTVTLVQPAEGKNIYSETLRKRGERPVDLSLWVRADLKPRTVPTSMAQGMRLKLVPLPVDMEDPAPWDEAQVQKGIAEKAEAEAILNKAHYSDWRTPPTFSVPEHLLKKD